MQYRIAVLSGAAALVLCDVYRRRRLWLYTWIAIIAWIKAANIAAGCIRQKAFVSVHSVTNKVTGGLLFIFPLTPAFIDVRYGAAVVCMVATAAAIQEGYLIHRKVIQ